jgi:diguanylate cyclase (GGDEF)-like protein/PAS domain S-box-containing protein
MQLDGDFYRRLLDNLHDGVYFTDTDRCITYWNKGAERITGYLAQEVVGKRCRDNILMHVDCRGNCLCMTACPMAHTMRDGEPRHVEAYLHHKEGYRLPVLVRVSPVHDEHGGICGAVEVFSDNSSKVSAVDRIQELEQIAYLDPLTELANRRFAEQHFETRLAEMRRHGWGFGVIMADIDHFKQINDQFGHEVGDRVLKMTAKTLLSAARPYDVVSRWGGEEFLIFVVKANEGDIHSVADRFCRLVGQSSLEHDDQHIGVTMSVGAAMAEANDDVQQIIHRVDALLYRSKQAGRNCTSSPFQTTKATGMSERIHYCI